MNEPRGPDPLAALLVGNSARRWIALATVLLLLLLAGWIGFQRGQDSGGAAREQERIARSVLEDKASRLARQNQLLNAKVAELEMARRLDRDAYGQVERTLGDLQSQLARQNDDLAFYKSIVSPTDGIQGLRIQRFQVEPGALPRQFTLKLTLVQAMRQDGMVSGLAQVLLNGMQGERPTKYSVGQLLGRPKAQLPFSFRYFQVVEQAVQLPEGFEPFEIDVEVRSSKLRYPMQRSFDWKTDQKAAL
jgi:hypothetical protein